MCLCHLQDIRELVTHMIQLDPSKRLPASTYLKNKLFPNYFAFLYKFLAKLLAPHVAEPDLKIRAIKQQEERLIREVLSEDAPAPPPPPPPNVVPPPPQGGSSALNTKDRSRSIHDGDSGGVAAGSQPLDVELDNYINAVGKQTASLAKANSLPFPAPPTGYPLPNHLWV